MERETSASRKNIVILGGSYGGVSISHCVLKHVVSRLPDQVSYQVIVVSASSQAMCRPACPRAMISDDMFPQDKLFVDISKQFEQYPQDSFRFVHGAANMLDHGNRTVSINLASGNTEKLGYYALVIATGASTTSPLFGLNRDVEYLRKSWAEFREALPAAKSIVIAGGGPTGIETAGELGEYLNGRSSGINPKVSITVVTAGEKILPVLRAALAKKAEDYLSNVGVTVIKNTRVKSVAPDGSGTSNVATKATLTLENGETIDTDLYIPAIGTHPNTSYIHKELLTADGRVETHNETLRVERAGPRVYAIGDVASYARPAVHHLFNAVPVLCTNIRRDLQEAAGLENVGEDRKFKEDTRETQMVPIGKGKGVGAAMGYKLPSLLVWLIKGRDYWLWTAGNLWNGNKWAKEP